MHGEGLYTKLHAAKHLDTCRSAKGHQEHSLLPQYYHSALTCDTSACVFLALPNNLMFILANCFVLIL